MVRSIEKGRVLLVDDEPDGLETASAVLEENFLVETAPDGRRALRAVIAAERAGTPFQVVCADYHMPMMNGVELLEALAERPIPLVGLLVTGVRDHVLKHALAPSAHDDIVFSVLLKPYDPRQLLEVVGKADHLARLKQAMCTTGRGPQRGAK